MLKDTYTKKSFHHHFSLLYSLRKVKEEAIIVLCNMRELKVLKQG